MLNKEIKETQEEIERISKLRDEGKLTDGEYSWNQRTLYLERLDGKLQTLKEIQEKIDKKVEELKKLKDKEGYYVFHWDDTKWILKEIDKIFGGQDEKATK